MKKNFLTGLVILIPVILTFLIVQFLVNLFTNPFVGFVEHIFGNTVWFGHLNNRDLAEPASKLLILIALPVIIIAIGIFGRGFIVKYVLTKIDSLARKIPFVNRVYHSIKEAVHALLEPQSNSFTSVVLVPFPNAPAYCIGFVTKEDVIVNSSIEQNNFITVFVPGTPNPTGGFMLIFQKEQLIFLDIKVEEAFKCVLSGGLILKDLKVKSET